MTIGAHECKRPAIANMDHRDWRDGAVQEFINRMCLTCGAHWYGTPDNVKQYTRPEWDAQFEREDFFAA